MVVALIGIVEVAERNGIELRPNRYRSGQYLAHCPECGDRGQRRNLEINEYVKGGSFHCWACDAHGGAVSFHAWLRGISFDEAKRELYPSSSSRPKRRQAHPAEQLTHTQLKELGFRGHLPYERPVGMSSQRWNEYRRDTLDWIWQTWQDVQQAKRESEEFWREFAVQEENREIHVSA
jgi:hypothetical protein